MTQNLKRCKAVYYNTSNGKTSAREYYFAYDGSLDISVDDIAVVKSPFSTYAFIIITEVTDINVNDDDLTKILCIVPKSEDAVY